MKILIVSDAWHPQLNGVVRTYEHLGEALQRLGHSIKVIGPGDFPATIPMPGYAEIRLALFPYARLRKMIEAWAPDLVHIATEGPLGWAARRQCLHTGMDFTTCYHTQFPEYAASRVPPWLSFIAPAGKKHVYGFMRRFHATAPAMNVATASLEKKLKAAGFRNRMTPMTRGVDLNLFSPGDATLFRDLPRPVALYVGRIAIEKNLEDFLRMDWSGSKILVGDGPNMDMLKQKYPRSVFAGRKTGHDLAAYYRSADVFVFPSKTETFGMVMIEALACGLPVAGYPVTGPVDIVTERFLGFLSADLAEAAEKSLQQGSAGERYDYIRSHYTWEKAAEQFLRSFRRGDA